MNSGALAAILSPFHERRIQQSPDQTIESSRAHERGSLCVQSGPPFIPTRIFASSRGGPAIGAALVSRYTVVYMVFVHDIKQGASTYAARKPCVGEGWADD
jgi:hypothetical protein